MAQRLFSNPGHTESMIDRRWQHIANFLIEIGYSATYFIDILKWNGTRMVALAGYLSCSASHADDANAVQVVSYENIDGR